MSISQTFTPHQLLSLPQKDVLVKEFVGKSLNELRTPAFVLDRAIFASNCARMHAKARQWGASFRAHLKTHKTAEGTRLQLISDADKTGAVVVSTLMEAWQVVNSGLVSEGTINDILYGLPVAINKIADLSKLWEEVSSYGCTVRLLIDNAVQVKALEEFEKTLPEGRLWSVFIKCDGGQRQVEELVPGSPAFIELLKAAFASPAVDVYGFYAHAGNSYASTSLDEASSFLSSEVQVVNQAAELAKAFVSADDARPSFVLSVGSTPTAHSASAEARERLKELLHGTLELHAGNYPLLDLQQLHTTLIDRQRIAQRVLSTVISYYPGRGADGSDEAMCDAGGIAMSKDTGPSGGFGDVIGKAWRLGRVSQEHGVLTRTKDGNGDTTLEVGDVIGIVGQHACMIAAAYPWYYIVDSSPAEESSKVVDVWVPWKGW
ncbi:putative serine dehydratase domain-containing protein [Vararia minispora EC-137]|uniref:Serine dehydratase domain-containing protein n=1 Tax=Vararia minispora EC-137 TaxID=1314806 RepID=A0ACB8QM66_9AGAM|nr:putative serine dehydratase domain-containing protein [Vararia minispora EC-137]